MFKRTAPALVLRMAEKRQGRETSWRATEVTQVRGGFNKTGDH